MQEGMFLCMTLCGFFGTAKDQHSMYFNRKICSSCLLNPSSIPWLKPVRYIHTESTLLEPVLVRRATTYILHLSFCTEQDITNLSYTSTIIQHDGGPMSKALTSGDPARAPISFIPQRLLNVMSISLLRNICVIRTTLLESWLHRIRPCRSHWSS
jgi:hypothetical protein